MGNVFTKNLNTKNKEVFLMLLFFVFFLGVGGTRVSENPNLKKKKYFFPFFRGGGTGVSEPFFIMNSNLRYCFFLFCFGGGGTGGLE